MAKIELNNDQLRLIQRALDLYSRIGILQLEEILDHPTIYNSIMKNCTVQKPLEVGDQTMRGEIVEMGKGYIKTKGSWGNGEEIKKWKDIDKIKLSPDWDKLQKDRETVRNNLNNIVRLVSTHGHSYGIHTNDTDESCREAFDIIQVIRHEFWKEDPKRSHMTVDSSISFTSTDTKPVKVTLDTVKEIRKEKLQKITKK